MSIELILILAATNVATALFLMLRLVSWEQLLRWHWFADVILTIGTFVLFSGTLGGTLVATVTGLTFSIVLTFGKWWQGVKQRTADRVARDLVRDTMPESFRRRLEEAATLYT